MSEHHHHDEDRLARIEAHLHRIEHAQGKIMSALSDLQASVTAEDTVIDGVVTLLEGLSAALAAAGTDPAALAALKTDIDARTKQMADAVVANTPVRPLKAK